MGQLRPAETEKAICMASQAFLSKKPSVVDTAFACSKLLVYWITGCLLLWFFYGMSIQVANENRTKLLAVELVMGMSLVITVLTACAWLFCPRALKGSETFWLQFIKAFLVTAAVLTAYLTVVLIRRNLWTQEQGISVYVQFLPVVGRINAEFFSEFNWLTFLSEVIPTMSLFSALLLNINFQRKPR
jgi:hypothetical protein